MTDQNLSLPLPDPAVAGHNALVHVTNFYGVLLETKRHEQDIATAQITGLRSEIARLTTAHNLQLKEGREYTNKVLDDLREKTQENTRLRVEHERISKVAEERRQRILDLERISESP